MKASEIRLRHETIDDVDFCLVEQDTSEAVRAAVVLPYSTAPILDGTMPSETPHVMEHVVCNGDGQSSSSEYDEYMEALGGHSNGSTYMTIDGRLKFETTQPDHGTDRAVRMINSAFNPVLVQQELDSEREIVRNELRGYLQNTNRQRGVKRLFELGLYYENDVTGLESLDKITVAHMRELHQSTFTRNNARLVLAGNPSAIEQTIQNASRIISSIPMGQRFTSARTDTIRVPDYHADAPEKPAGTTEYSYCLVSEHEQLDKKKLEEIKVAMNALASFMQTGKHGLMNQSRNRGLSYGVRFGWSFSDRQATISIGDSTQVTHVNEQLRLFDETISRLDSYTPQDYDNFRAKLVGSSKLQPEDAIQFSRNSVEDFVASGQERYLHTPSEFRRLIAEADAEEVTATIKLLAQRFKAADFIVRYSFGENPF